MNKTLKLHFYSQTLNNVLNYILVHLTQDFDCSKREVLSDYLNSEFDDFTPEASACLRLDTQTRHTTSPFCSFLADCADLWDYLIYLMYHAFDCIYSIAVTQDANKYIICSLITPSPLIINHCQYQ